VGIGLRRIVLPIVFSIFLLGGLSSAQLASAITLTFDEIVIDQGEQVTNQFTVSHGVTISATNPGSGPDKAIIFDTDMFIPSSGDPDLTGPPDCPNWTNTNFVGGLQEELHNVLIIAENNNDDDDNTTTSDTGSCTESEPSGSADGIIDVADDQAGNNMQTLIFAFNPAICKIGFDLLDVEQGGEVLNGMFASFKMSAPAGQKEIGFEDFETGGAFDQGANFGNHTLNRVGPLTVAQLGLQEIDEMKIMWGGSGAIDNLVFEKCEFVGGHGGPIDKTALMVTGAQLNAAWMIPVLVSAIGIGVFVVTRK